jgi:hypothetical protein
MPFGAVDQPMTAQVDQSQTGANINTCQRAPTTMSFLVEPTI